jgi:hypothetical protein
MNTQTLRKNVITAGIAGMCLVSLACGLFTTSSLSTSKVAMPPLPTEHPTEPTLIPGQQVGQPPSGTGLLQTSSLDLGLQGWDEWLQGGSRVQGHNTVRLVEGPMFARVVDFSRTEGGNDGGAAGLVQPLDADVSGYQHIYVWLVGRVLNEQGGNIANHDPRWFPEGAVQVSIKYLTRGQEEGEWYHGFYVQDVDGADTAAFTQVAQDEWFTYTSPDLMALQDPPERITELRIYGFGWEFHGQVAEVNIIGQ